MKSFTSSAKPLTFYVETKAVIKLGETFGHKLDRLSQEEKYQLCTCIALMLWGCCDSGIGEGRCNPNDEGDDDGIDFGDLMAEDNEPDLITSQNDQLVPEITANVMTALVILQHESPEILAQLLPAIAEYARDDDR